MKPADALARLTAVNLDDLVDSFGWRRHPMLATFLRTLFRGPARKFARQMLAFDDLVGERGLAQAARQTLAHYVREVRLHTAAPVPDGPFLALSNHPGMTDTLALFTALEHPDLRIIAVARPFLQALPNVGRRLDFVTDDSSARMRLVRNVSAHLRAGGAALTFPAGSIEPDPAVYPGALESLERWTESAGVFLRLAPRTSVLPVLVRGVIWERAARHPLTRIKKSSYEKEKLAAALQLLAHVALDLRPVRVHVQLGRPVTTQELGTTDAKALHAAVRGEMRRLFENPPVDSGQAVL